MKITTLLEARIAVPDSLRRDAMNLVASAVFSHAYSLTKGKLSPELKQAATQAQQKYGKFKLYKIQKGGSLDHTLEFDPKQLPASYTKGLKVQQKYPLKISVGEFGPDADGAMAYYTPMGRGSSGKITVNLSMVPEMDQIGSVEGVDAILDNLEGAVAHELQHATQDVVLRKRHASQMELPKEGDSKDDYFGSTIEFQPQITTAAADFKRMVKMVRRDRDLDSDTIKELMRVFVRPGGSMPQGLLRYKPHFQSEFFNSLYKSNPQKWKKAVKDFHRLLVT